MIACTIAALCIDSMTLSEKVAQLFVIPVGEEFSQEQKEAVTVLVEKGVGNLIIKQGTAEGQRKLIEELQAHAKIPLFCFQDAEWGVAMRLRDVAPFPKQMTLGAIEDLDLLYRTGQEIGWQLNAELIDFNLAPVADVNSCPSNPIIGMRSFGDDPEQVGLRAERISSGMQSTGIYTCAKHFPGHGNVSVDSHQALPCVLSFRPEDLIPFQRLIDSGVDAVMSAHLLIPELADEPVTFSSVVITDLLRKQLAFKGLIITDALNMKAMTLHYTPQEIAIGALRAGHDLLLYGDHIAPCIDEILFKTVPLAMQAIEEAVLNKEIAEEEIDAHVLRILDKKQRTSPKNTATCKQIESRTSEGLILDTFLNAITVLQGKNLLPLQGKIAVIADSELEFFGKQMGGDFYLLQEQGWRGQLDRYATVVAAIHTPSNLWEELVATGCPLFAVLFNSPYKRLPFLGCPGLMIAYEKLPAAQRAAAEILLGIAPSRGRLPIANY